MIKLKDSNGNISVIQDNGDIEFDNKRVEEEFKQAEIKANNDNLKGGE